MINGSTLFTNRATYTLVAVDGEIEKLRKGLLLLQLTFFPTVKDYSLPKYIPLLDNIESDLATKLYALSNPDQRLSKNFKGRKQVVSSKQLAVTQVQGQAKGKQSGGTSSSLMKKQKSKGLM